MTHLALEAPNYQAVIRLLWISSLFILRQRFVSKLVCLSGLRQVFTSVERKTQLLDFPQNPHFLENYPANSFVLFLVLEEGVC